MLEALHQTFQALNLLLLILPGFFLNPDIFQLLPAVCRIVSGIAGQAPVLQFPDGIRRAVEKIPVMRYDDHRLFIIPQILFQPLCGIGVQMIGGFVQEQQIRFLEQQADESQFRLLSPGEHGDRFLLVFF